MSEAMQRLLIEHEALLEGHFLLSSGRHSQRYLQCAVALQFPDAAEQLGSTLARELLATLGAPPDVVVSPAMGGLIIGHETGRGLGRRACFTERVDGKMCLRRGFHLQAGERVVLIEDVVTTGLSSRETLDVIRAEGAVPVAVGCIANRSGQQTLDDLPLVSLVRLDFPTWSPGECPACAAGSAPIKPGSRGA
jgi:orotate phosphoribosyltransferase